VFCSFLALVLKKALEDRIAALGHAGSWPEIIADLDALTETEHDGKRFLLRVPRHGLPPVSRCAPPASRCRRPCAKPPSIDPFQNVVPRRRGGANRHCRSIT
jgi:hypothetical protein